MQPDIDLDEDTLSLQNVNATAKLNDTDARLTSPANAAMHARAIFEVRTRTSNIQAAGAFGPNPTNQSRPQSR